MNKDTLAGQWKQLRGDVQVRWGKLTDDDLDVVAGNMEKLAGLLQERYGIARDEAQRRVDEFTKEHLVPEAEEVPAR